MFDILDWGGRNRLYTYKQAAVAMYYHVDIVRIRMTIARDESCKRSTHLSVVIWEFD